MAEQLVGTVEELGPGSVRGRMVIGPQAGFEKVPGLDTAFIQLTKLWPLRRDEVVACGGKVYVRD